MTYMWLSEAISLKNNKCLIKLFKSAGQDSVLAKLITSSKIAIAEGLYRSDL